MKFKERIKLKNKIYTKDGNDSLKEKLEEIKKDYENNGYIVNYVSDERIQIISNDNIIYVCIEDNAIFLDLPGL